MNVKKRLKTLALEHWNKIACGSTTETPIGGSCPYCGIYGGEYECGECPIAIKTREGHCDNTPFYEVSSTWGDYDDREGNNLTPWQANCADAIEAMLELIESLPED